jgi:enediyne biosynthesis protein E4
VFDVNGDGRMDIVCAGNNWGAEVETVRYDAGVGSVLLGDGKGGFTAMPATQSGLFAWGNAKDVALLQTGADGVNTVIVANNNDVIQAFRLKRKTPPNAVAAK